MPDVELTELHDIKVVRQDGVKNPASGYTFLVMKALAHPEDTQMAMDDDDADDTGPVGASGTGCGCCSDCTACGPMTKSEAVEGFVYKRDFSAAERKKLASEGKALSDGSYPIENESDLKNAAHLAASGHGNVAAAKRLIAKRAKELGVANPLDNETKKDEQEPEAPESTETTEVTETPDGDGVEKDAIAKQIADAVAEVRKDAEKRIEALAAELAVIKATPIPGGPMLAPTADQNKTRARSDWLAKAAYHDRLADKTNGELARYHRDEAKAARERAKA